MAQRGCLAALKNLLCCCCKGSSPERYQQNQSIISLDHHQQYNPQHAMHNPIRLEKSNITNNYRQILDKVLGRKRKWNMVEGSHIRQDKTCSICLVDTANIKLECGHFFHRSCLWQWYNTKKSCPNCRKQTTNIYIYCEKCSFEYYTVSLTTVMRQKVMDSFGRPIQITCQDCQKDIKRQSQLCKTSKIDDSTIHLTL